jgi:murein DD-endopeptidase MepM/ murein hydrolase activator NlpD
VALELGPTYYIGYLTSISVNHLMFTEEYVPIRSDVSLSMNVMANGTTTAAILGNSPETSTTTETPDGTRITNPDGSSAMGTVPGDVTSSQTNVVLGWPLPGVGYPTSKAAKVGCRTHPVTGKKSCHTGIDISAPSGTPIRCAAKGKVIKRVTTDSVWGKHVWVEHSKGFVTKYNHMSEISVSLNQSVDAGAILGEVGETGLATGPHLHFEVAINGEAWDPLSWFGYPAQKVGCAKTGCV